MGCMVLALVLVSLALRLQLGLSFRFTFCIYNVSTKPTAFSSCVTVTLQEVVK